nr:putative ribonuclease H-like domain-containing protein [Tanacetum cinerariifolium]
MAFVSSSNNSSTNGAVNTTQAVNNANGVSTANTQVNDAFSLNIDNLSDVVICAFLASQPNSPQLIHEDLEQIHPDDIEEIDLRWQMAMLIMRARRFLKKTGRKLTINGNETIGFDKSNIECYNCHKKGHFARECRAPRNHEIKHKESTRRSMPLETPAFIALVSCDGLSRYDWSDQAKEGPNYALMAFTSSSSDSKIVDNCKKKLGYENYNAVPPPYTGNFMPLKLDLSFIELDEFVNKHVIVNCEAKSSEKEPKEVRKNNDAPIIKEWVLDDEEDDVTQPKIEQKIVKPSIIKKELVKPRQQEKTSRKTVKKVKHIRQNTHRPRVVKAVKGNHVTAIKASACWVWKPMTKVIDHGNSQMDLQDKGVIDSGCSRHMTWNMSYLIDYKEINRGYVAFGENPKGGKITEKCTIKTATKDETSGILKSFIIGIENLVDQKIKVIRCDDRTEFKNKEMNQFCEIKGIKRQFSVARTRQQNGVAKRRNRTLIEAARTMLADSKLPTTFWAEAVNIACYVKNRVLVVKPYNKTPYENFHGSGLDWLFDIDALTRTMIYEPIVVGTQSNGFTDIKDNAGQARKETESVKDYILLPLWTVDPSFSQDLKSSHDDGFKPSSDDEKKVDEDPSKGSEYNELPFDLDMPALEDVGTFYFSNEDDDDDDMDDVNNLDTTIQVSPTPTTRIHKDHPLDQVIKDLQSATQIRNMTKNMEEHGFLSTIQQRTNHKDLQNCLFACFLSQKNPKGFKDPDFPNRVYKVEKALYGLHQAPRAWFTEVKNARTPMETQKPLLKDEDGKEVDVHTYRSMIGSLIYLTSLIPDIMFAMCACARYQVNPKVSHLHAVKRIFRLISWQCKKQTVVANFTTEAEYVVASSCCGQVL